MRKSMKECVKVLACVVLPVVMVCVVLAGLCCLGFHVRLWQERYVEYHPGELLPYLEKGPSLEFPSGIKEFKTAKRQVTGDAVDLLLKFTTEPDAANGFLESFPEGIAKEMLHESARSYKKEKDTRSSHGSGVPKCCKPPFSKARLRCITAAIYARKSVATRRMKRFMWFILMLFM